MKYRSASYSAEIHPDQREDLEDALVDLPMSNPESAMLHLLLGMDLLVDMKVCGQCGAVVHDPQVHGVWHDRNDR